MNKESKQILRNCKSTIYRKNTMRGHVRVGMGHSIGPMRMGPARMVPTKMGMGPGPAFVNRPPALSPGPAFSGRPPGPPPAPVARPPGPPPGPAARPPQSSQVNVNVNSAPRTVVNEVIVGGGPSPLLPAAGLMLGTSLVAGAVMGAAAASAVSGPREVIVTSPQPQPSTVIVNTPGIQQQQAPSTVVVNSGAPIAASPPTTVVVENGVQGQQGSTVVTETVVIPPKSNSCCCVLL